MRKPQTETRTEMDEDMSTSMDQLIELLEKNGSVKISDAARELSADKGRIESWARMLEKAGMIEIHYSVIGGAILKKGPKFSYAAKRAPVAAPAMRADAPAPKARESGITVDVSAPKATETEKNGEMPADIQQEYALIKKRIEEEESIIDKDLKMLYQEHAIISQYMSTLITEGNKLSEYIENLRQLVEKSRMEKGKPMPT
jgi:hypothetical protein